MKTRKKLRLFDSPVLTHKNNLKNQQTTKPQITNNKSENFNKSVPLLFKALLHETSVYEYYIELKEDALTSNGYLDIVKVPSLRIAGAGRFFKKLRLENHLRQKEIAEILNISISQVKHWEKDRNIPLDKLVKIAKILDVSKKTIYSLIDKGKFKTKIGLPVKFEKICDIIHHFSPNKVDVSWPTSVIKRSKETLSKIKVILNVKPTASGKIINSKELHNYLTTFFRYIKVPKINLPLTKEVQNWHVQGVDLKRAIICPCLQTDGSTTCKDSLYVINFHGINKILHNYFVDAMYYEYKELPSSYFRNDGSEDCYVTVYKRNLLKEILYELMNIAGSSKTSPANRQPVDEYLKEPQPNLNYLINASEIEQKIALRVWASTEGWIGLYRRKNGHVSPRLEIACAHPDLAIQLKQIARRFNINFGITRSKSTWSGIRGLSADSVSSCIEFQKLGGFFKGVKISAYSKYHKGIQKDVYLLGILEFKRRQKTSLKLRNLSLRKIHNEINKIIKNREYNAKGYYINYFS